MKIGSKFIGEGRVYIIAELSGNHNQSFEIASQTIHAIALTGADAVKLQTYTPDSITLNVNKPDFMTRHDGPWAGQTLYSLYQKAYTPWEWHAPLQAIALECGLDFFSSPFDLTAVDFLAQLDVPAYKIASFEITDTPLIDYTARQGKPIIISTGIADEADIQLALDTCYRAGNHDVILLKCTSEYPALPEEVNLKTIPLLRSRFSVPVGLSDHSQESIVPLVAVGLGVVIIEKHVILDKSLGGVDSFFSLDIDEFKQMVDAVRYAEKTLGVASLALTPKIEKAKEGARSLYIVKNVKKGDLLTSKNLRSVRPGYGLHPRYYNELIGQRFAIDAEAGTRMSFSMISR